jgi:hypothetical protein
MIENLLKIQSGFEDAFPMFKELFKKNEGQKNNSDSSDRKIT